MIYRELVNRFVVGLNNGVDPFLMGVVETRFNGRPLGDHEVGFRTTSQFESRFNPIFTAKVAMAHVAVALRLEGEFVDWPGRDGIAAIPDFIYLENGQVKGVVDLKQLEDPAERRRRDLTADFNVATRMMLDQDPSLRAALGRRFVEITLSFDAPPVAVGSLVPEIRTFLQRGLPGIREQALDLIPREFPILSSLGARCYSSNAGPEHLGLSLGARTVDSRWYLRELNQLLADVRVVSALYENYWVILYAVDPLYDQINGDFASYARTLLNGAPVSTIVVAAGREAVVAYRQLPA